MRVGEHMDERQSVSMCKTQNANKNANTNTNIANDGVNVLLLVVFVLLASVICGAPHRHLERNAASDPHRHRIHSGAGQHRRLPLAHLGVGKYVSPDLDLHTDVSSPPAAVFCAHTDAVKPVGPRVKLEQMVRLSRVGVAL